jgi:beta-glucanase (GH16 family)
VSFHSSLRTVAGALSTLCLVPVLLTVAPMAQAASPTPTTATKAGLSTSSMVDADGCGATVLKADGSPWRCTFSDNFSGTALDRSKWLPQTVGYTMGSPTDWVCYVDDPSVLGVSGGVLTLRVIKGANQPCRGLTGSPSTRYRGASVSTSALFSQQYGRFEARIKDTASTSPGLQESFWMWPDARYPAGQGVWPANGEIDVAETYSQYPNLAIPFLHTSYDWLGPIPGWNTAWNCAAARGVWNTYTLEWSATRLEIFVNGVSCLVNTSGDSAFQKRYVMALTQGLGQSGNALTANTTLPVSIDVDYVRVWQ